MKALALVVLLLGAAPARASFLESVAFHAVPQAADTYSSFRAFDRGAGEANPLMRNRLQFLAVKGVMTTAMGWGDWQIGRKSKTLQWVGRGAVVVGYGFIVHHNMRAGRVVRNP